MLSFGVNTIEPIAPHGDIVPSFSISKLVSQGSAPDPIYPFGERQEVNPQEFSP